MHRLRAPGVLLLLLLHPLLIGPLSDSNAQRTHGNQDAASPSVTLEPAAGLTHGISLAELAIGTSGELLDAPVLLLLERVALDSGSGIQLRHTSGPELLFVESGDTEVSDDLGLVSSIGEGLNSS